MSRQIRVDLLIPTFNRATYLEKNLILLDSYINSEIKHLDLRILVADNNSTDNTHDIVSPFLKAKNFKVCYFKHELNIGLEANAVFLLNQSDADYVMYIGDDDYIPSGYLSYVQEVLLKDAKATSIIPGMSSLYPDGTIKNQRAEKFDEVVLDSGFITTLHLSHLGHQLSGVLLMRKDLYEEYIKKDYLRNIYPFIFFLSFNLLRGRSYYTPSFSVLVSQGNSKDWKYDDSGLVTEIVKNYKIVFPRSWIKRYLLNLQFILTQGWRLRIGWSFRLMFRSFKHLIFSRDFDFSLKLSLFWIYPFLFLVRALSHIKKKLIS